MKALTDASLTPAERRVTQRLVELLEAEFGPDLRAVWLYGSRARGEPPGDDSDIDLLVVSTRGECDEDLLAIKLAFEAAAAEGANAADFRSSSTTRSWSRSAAGFAPSSPRRRTATRSCCAGGP